MANAEMPTISQVAACIAALPVRWSFAIALRNVITFLGGEDPAYRDGTLAQDFLAIGPCILRVLGRSLVRSMSSSPVRFPETHWSLVGRLRDGLPLHAQSNLMA